MPRMGKGGMLKEPELMDKTIAKVTVELPGNVFSKWRIHGERIKALTDFLDWAEGQRLAEEKRTEISRRVRAKKKR